MFCHYRNGNMNPRLLLKPVKEEDEWDSPRIVRYLDMLSDEEIEKIKELAKPRVRLMINKNKCLICPNLFVLNKLEFLPT